MLRPLYTKSRFNKTKTKIRPSEFRRNSTPDAACKHTACVNTLFGYVMHHGSHDYHVDVCSRRPCCLCVDRDR